MNNGPFQLLRRRIYIHLTYAMSRRNTLKFFRLRKPNLFDLWWLDFSARCHVLYVEMISDAFHSQYQHIGAYFEIFQNV